MNFVFPYQMFVDLSLEGKKSAYPNFLKDVVKRAEFTDLEKLQEFLSTELENTSVQYQEAAEYFIFIAKEVISHYFYRKDFDGFHHAVDLTRHRMPALRNVTAVELNLASWDQYIKLMQVAFLRLIRHIPIEEFESHIDQMDWAGFEKDLIPAVSSVVGYVYLNEDEADQTVKSRLWLQKAIRENDFEHNLGNYLAIAYHYLSDPQAESIESVTAIITQLKEGIPSLSSPGVKQLFEAAIFDLEAKLLPITFLHIDNQETRLEHCQQELRDFESQYRRTSQDSWLPELTKASIEATLAKLNALLYGMTDDSLEQAGFARDTLRSIEKSIERAEALKDEYHTADFKLTRIELAVATGTQLTEKEAREIVQYNKKGNDYPTYIRSVSSYVHLMAANDNAQKSYDAIMDVFKLGHKRLEESGGFYLITSGLRLANELFQAETHAPGVSWMVHNLDIFFEQIKRTIELLDQHLDTIGVSMVEQFRREYANFEPVSHFNIKVYFQYQLYQIKALRVGTIMHNDSVGEQSANSLIASLENPNNPMSFIAAMWEDYKDVPNSVRNKTLNKCINISKGDLPLAAEHLDFSYRNLRSYITFKEVNRLGFFLDIQQTTNRQLEQGIRYMFFDLYKRGTIFEVVFDMPRFLVKYASLGFFSQDLEQELNIKGTTAKKYIKIMMEIKLIRQDKTTGRKHYYRLVRENVMKRLGKDQTTMIKPQV